MMATATAPPPSYELPGSEPSSGDSLPDYSPRAARASRPTEEREFEYKAERKKGETVASLKVLAPAMYSKNIPTFCGAGPVKGSAHLYLKEPDTITSVVVSVRGRFLPGKSDEELKLFEILNTMWSKDADALATSPIFSNKKKLSGTHSWPFSVTIPEKVRFEGDKFSSSLSGEHNTPQTFNERALWAGIQYEVILRVGRGKLRNDYKIPCTFGYIPLIRPPPFPALKTIAYQERTPLLDPTVDVDGWIPMETVKISGTLFNSHIATIDYQLFISGPLVYTRGSVIPLYVRMRSTDHQALDLLVTHKTIKVRLERKIRHYLPERNLKEPENYYTSMGRDAGDLVEAVWWPASYQEQGAATKDPPAHTACLNAELHLKTDLFPSSTIPVFTVDYFVSLRSFEIPGFRMLETEKSLLDHPVDVVTSFAPGPRAVRFAPPGYDSERPLNVEHGVPLQRSLGFL